MRPSASAGCACKYIPAYLRKAVLHAENVLMVRGGELAEAYRPLTRISLQAVCYFPGPLHLTVNLGQRNRG